MSRSNLRKHHAAAAIAAAILLQGCGSQGNWAGYFQLVRESWKTGLGSQSVPLEVAAEIPYASLGYRIDGKNQALLVLATNTDGEMLWTAASRVVLVMRESRILRSVGLPNDRVFLTPRNSRSIPPLAAALKAAYRSERTVDIPDLGAYSVLLTCVTAPRGRALVTILGTALATTRVDETCRSSRPNWVFTDSYWLDDAGFARRSVQHLHPLGTTIMIEIFRPPE